MNRRDFFKQALGFMVVSAVGPTALTSCSSKKDNSSFSEEEKANFEKVGGKTYTYLGFERIGNEQYKKNFNQYMLRLDENNDGKAEALWIVDPLNEQILNYKYYVADVNAVLELEPGSRITVEDLVHLTPRSNCELHILRPVQDPLVYKLRKGSLRSK